MVRSVCVLQTIKFPIFVREASFMQVVKSYPDNMFCWVDLATTDVAAAKEFYSGLFGWSYFDMPTPLG